MKREGASMPPGVRKQARLDAIPIGDPGKVAAVESTSTGYETPTPVPPADARVPLFIASVGAFVDSEVWTDTTVDGVRFKLMEACPIPGEILLLAVQLLRSSGNAVVDIVTGTGHKFEQLSAGAVTKMPKEEFDKFADQFPAVYVHDMAVKSGHDPLRGLKHTMNIDGTAIPAVLASGELAHTIFVKSAGDRLPRVADQRRHLYSRARTLAHEIVHSWRLHFAVQLVHEQLSRDSEGDVTIDAEYFQRIATPPRENRIHGWIKLPGRPPCEVGEAGRYWENAISEGACTMDGDCLIIALQDGTYETFRLTDDQVERIIQDPRQLQEVSRSMKTIPTPAPIKLYDTHSGNHASFAGCWRPWGSFSAGAVSAASAVST